MEIGDIVHEIPATFGDEASENGGRGKKVPRRGRVVYIHPEKRFYVVEFPAKLGKSTIRESFFFGGV